MRIYIIPFPIIDEDGEKEIMKKIFGLKLIDAFNFWYLHGVLEDKFNFDTALMYVDLETYESDIVEMKDGKSYLVQGIYELILEMVLCKNEYVVIASSSYPAELVKSKFLKLDYSHVEYVLGCFQSNTTKVKNIKKYLLAALFNASSTISGYYRAEVNHDMPQFVIAK